MIKQSQIFGWEHESAMERPSAYRPVQSGSAAASCSSSDGNARADPACRAAAAQTAVKREPPNPRDKMLSAFARAWVDALPRTLQPQSLCAQYPRIANRLALCWADPGLTDQIFASLLEDKRRGRAGFPREVAEELGRLRADVTAQMRKGGR